MTAIAHKDVKTRKEQRCWGCARKFPVGTVLTRVTNVDGRYITSSYWCPTCSEYMDVYVVEDGVECGQLFNDEDWLNIKKYMEDECRLHNRLCKRFPCQHAGTKMCQRGSNTRR